MKKIIFFLAWLGIFVFSLLGILYVVYPSYFIPYDISEFTYKMIILNVSILYLILTLYKIKTKFAKKVDYEITTQSGKVTVSSNSIKSMVKEVLSSDLDISLVKVETIKRRGRFDIILSIETVSNIKLNEKTAFIQENIKKILKQNIGIDVDHVEIKLLKIKSQ